MKVSNAEWDSRIFEWLKKQKEPKQMNVNEFIYNGKKVLIEGVGYPTRYIASINGEPFNQRIPYPDRQMLLKDVRYHIRALEHVEKPR